MQTAIWIVVAFFTAVGLLFSFVTDAGNIAKFLNWLDPPEKGKKKKRPSSNPEQESK